MKTKSGNIPWFRLGRTVFLLLGMVAFSGMNLWGAEAPEKDASYLKAKPQDMEWFTQARFGMFVHWDVSSILGTEISWSRGGFRRGLPNKKREGVPVEDYDNLYKQFNPSRFNADEWVAAIKAAGMKYLIFTTKHHGGFCMFDSKLTDYDIMSTPYGKDIVAQLAKACQKNGIRIGWYYSPPDWHHPDYYTDHHDRYIQYLHGQVRELLTQYGKIDVMWFDNLSCTIETMDSYGLYKMIRTLQPGILINNRLALPGDFDTPEQYVGAFDDQRPWESCITLGTSWSWRPGDSLKTVKESVHLLVNTVGGDGNLLFDVGPMPDGRIEPRQVAILKGVGEWMKKYGETIYGTRGGPVLPSRFGVSTHKGATVYVHVLNWPESGPLTIKGIAAPIKSSKVLTGGTAEVVQNGDTITISVPADQRADMDTIVELTFDKPVEGYAKMVTGSLAMGKPCKASNDLGGPYVPESAIDDNPSTRWATDEKTRACSLEVDLGEVMPVGRVEIMEFYAPRIESFVIESRRAEGDCWEVIVCGNRPGHKFTRAFTPVQARFVRLRVLDARNAPTISEFMIFPK